MTFENAYKNSVRDLATLALSLDTHSELIIQIGRLISGAMSSGHKLYAFGNGGSSASASHFVAEFTGKLKKDRRPLPAYWIGSDMSAVTAIGNDYGFDHIFERQVEALVTAGDVVIGLSTSGHSSNVLRGLKVAKNAGAITVLITGASGDFDGDFHIAVASNDTPRIQESHDFILHMIAQCVESELFPELNKTEFRDPFSFVLSSAEVPAFSSWIKQSRISLVTTNGVFDLLHSGHRRSLEFARSLGDQLVVLINTDESVRMLKGEDRPIRSLETRIDDLRSISHVSHVIPFSENNPLSLLESLRPSVHVKGSEYMGKGIPELALERFGTRIEFFSRLEEFSTTSQILNFRKGD